MVGETKSVTDVLSGQFSNKHLEPIIYQKLAAKCATVILLVS